MRPTDLRIIAALFFVDSEAGESLSVPRIQTEDPMRLNAAMISWGSLRLPSTNRRLKPASLGLEDTHTQETKSSTCLAQAALSRLLLKRG